MQGTWSDAIIIQAVADQLKLKIIIAETHEQFSDYTVVQAVSSTQQMTKIYLGHIDEFHYVSTLPCSLMPDFNQNQLNSSEKLLDINERAGMNSIRKDNCKTSNKERSTLSYQSKQQKKTVHG